MLHCIITAQCTWNTIHSYYITVNKDACVGQCRYIVSYLAHGDSLMYIGVGIIVARETMNDHLLQTLNFISYDDYGMQASNYVHFH